MSFSAAERQREREKAAKAARETLSKKPAPPGSSQMLIELRAIRALIERFVHFELRISASQVPPAIPVLPPALIPSPPPVEVPAPPKIELPSPPPLLEEEMIELTGDDEELMGFDELPPPPDAAAQWRQWQDRVGMFRQHRIWLDAWGPRPGQVNCMAPHDLLMKHERH